MPQRALQSFSPFLQILNYQSDYFTSVELEHCVSESAAAQARYRNLPLATKEAWFQRLGQLLEKDKMDLAALITTEMGKPIAQSRAEIEKCAHLCGFYADRAEAWLRPRAVEQGSGVHMRVEYHPLGLLLGIMPWNFPFWQVFRCAVPALLAGNGVLMKHAPNVPMSALRIEKLFREAGFPVGIYQNLFITEEQAGQLLADERIRGVSLTGSEQAGRSVAMQAGRHLKPQVLELGGSDPFIVMPDASLESTVAWAVKARLICNGQSCIAAKRFLIHQNIYEAFLSVLKQQLSQLTFGDPMEEQTNVGPLARLDLAEQLRSQVKAAVASGAKVEAEYGPETENPHFVPVTVLSGIGRDNPIYSQELFGPVFSLYTFQDRDEALRLANDTSFGLGASVWTDNTSDQEFFVQYLEAGTVALNQMVASHAAVPFGGVKNSGYGRELSEEGIRAFCNIKTVVTACKEA